MKQLGIHMHQSNVNCMKELIGLREHLNQLEIQIVLNELEKLDAIKDGIEPEEVQL